jgi:hypothetical protein
MVGRCPSCRREIYALAVFAFSHGEGKCSCGYVVTPWLTETMAPDPSYPTATAEQIPDVIDATTTTSRTASGEPR